MSANWSARLVTLSPKTIAETEPNVRWLRRPIFQIVLYSAFIAAAGNPAIWRNLNDSALLKVPGSPIFAPTRRGATGMLLVMQGFFLAWRWTLRTCLVLVLLISAFGSYFMPKYGALIDASMLVNVLPRMKCLRSHKNDLISHDNLLHSVLSPSGVQMDLYQRKLVAHSPCSSG